MHYVHDGTQSATCDQCAEERRRRDAANLADYQAFLRREGEQLGQCKAWLQRMIAVTGTGSSQYFSSPRHNNKQFREALKALNNVTIG